MDAAQDHRAIEVEKFLKQKFGAQLQFYKVGLEGQRIQFDTVSCPVFGIEILSKSSKEADIFKRMEGIGGIANNGKTKVIDWLKMGARYYKLAQSASFLQKAVDQMLPDEKSKPISDKHSYTIEELMKAQHRTLRGTARTTMNIPFVGEVETGKKDFTKVQHAATDLKTLTYVEDAARIITESSAESLTALMAGNYEEATIVHPDNPAFGKDFEREIDLGTITNPKK